MTSNPNFTLFKVPPLFKLEEFTKTNFYYSRRPQILKLLFSTQPKLKCSMQVSTFTSSSFTQMTMKEK